MESRVDFSKIKKALITEVMNFCGFAHFRKSSVFLKSAPHFHHDFTMLFFDNQVWVNLRQNIVESLTCKLDVKNSLIKFSSSIRGFELSVISTIKCFGNPFHNILVCITNFDVSMVVPGNIARSRFGIKNTNEKTTFTIDKSSEISQVIIGKHNIPCLRLNNHKLLLYFMSTLNDLASGMRKHIRKSELYGDIERDLRRGNPANVKQFYIGHKSNRLPVLNSAAARLGQARNETSDVLQRDNLEATASVVNCVGGTNGDVPTEMALSDTDDIVSTLQQNDGEYIMIMIPGTDKISTSPVGDAYGVMCTARMIPVLNAVDGFIRKQNYPNVNQTLSTEWGGVNNLRFFISSQGSVTANSSLLGNDVANCFVSAKEGYKVVHQAGGKAKFIYLPPGLMLAQVKSSLIELKAA